MDRSSSKLNQCEIHFPPLPPTHPQSLSKKEEKKNGKERGKKKNEDKKPKAEGTTR